MPEQLAGALDAYLGWIDEHSDSYAKLIESATGSDDVRSYMQQVRADTVDRMLAVVVRGGDPAAVRTALHGFLWFLDGACLEWLAHRDLSRATDARHAAYRVRGRRRGRPPTGPQVELAFP